MQLPTNRRDFDMRHTSATKPGRKGVVVKSGTGYRAEQGSDYQPGVSTETVGSQMIWLGRVTLPPGARTKAHVHEHHETALYMTSGDALELWTGDELEHCESVRPGDYIYIPANVLPVLTTTTAAGAESDTIMQGVVLLWSPTGWPLSLIVLFASIMIPSAKILALAYLLITAQRGSIKNNTQRIRLYRMVEFIGRWSMVDVFVDTFTAALIQLQPLMSVEPGPGLFFFAAVVVLTMLAVESFDPRLIWDATSSKEVRYA